MKLLIKCFNATLYLSACKCWQFVSWLGIKTFSTPPCDPESALSAETTGTTARCCRRCRPATSKQCQRWGPGSWPAWGPTWRASCSSSRTSPAPPAPTPQHSATRPAGGTCPCSTSSPASGVATPPTCLPRDQRTPRGMRDGPKLTSRWQRSETKRLLCCNLGDVFDSLRSSTR